MEAAFTLQQFLKMMKKRWLLTIVLTLMSLAIAATVSFYFITPQYEAKTQLLVNQKTTVDEIWVQTETDLQLISTYNVLMTSSVIIEQVIERLDLTMTPNQLVENISVTNEQDSKVLNLVVNHENHAQAVEIVNMWAEIIQTKIPELMNIDNINVLSYAQQEASPVPKTPNIPVYVGLGTVLGLMMSIASAFLLEIFDTTIKNEQQIEELLKMPVIGVVSTIPYQKDKKLSRKILKEKSGHNAWLEK